MRFVLTFGRLTVFDLHLFDIKEQEEKPDIVVVHHYNDEEDDEEKNDGPGDMFGSTGR